MSFTQALLLLQLLSLVSASHNYGGSSTFTYKGRNPDGTFRVEIRDKTTLHGCGWGYNWYCYSGNCGSFSTVERGMTGSGGNAPGYQNRWCETETVTTRNIPSDRPFQLRAASCCWIHASGISSWNLATYIDLGTRSDTGKPNSSPDIGVLPLLRVPQNCPRRYKLMSFDPDGDRVQCRIGNIHGLECSSCQIPSGFSLNQGSCTLNYQGSSQRGYAFEMMVEDFPQRGISLRYADGFQSFRHRRAVITSLSISSWAPWQTAAPTTWWGAGMTSAQPAQPTSTLPPATAPAASTPSPWWWSWIGATSTPPPTTAPAASTSTPWWWSWTRAASTMPPATTPSTPNPTPWWWSWTGAASTMPPATTPATPNPTPWWWSWTGAASTMPPATTPATPPPTTAHVTPTTPLSTTRAAYTTTPLSKLPLQFTFLVDPPISSCQEGLYLPRFLSPTPENEARIHAEVDKELEIRVKAQASYTAINDLLISGPLNISKHRTTHDEFVIRWTPQSDDLGNYFPICFAAESVLGSRAYQSEMRCVLVLVGEAQVVTNVICEESTMTVEVERDSIYGLSEDHLQLSDPTNTVCRLRSNSTHISAVIPLNSCGTQIEEDEDNLIFKNELTTFENSTGLITRKHLLEVQFYCEYPKRSNVTLSFSVHRESVTVMEKGFGVFTYDFEFYPDQSFNNMINPNSYPLEYDIGNRIYMQIQASTTVNNTHLFVESCSASPYDTPNYSPTYSIIDNGCNMDPTVTTYTPSNERQFRFSMEAFKFIGLHDQVYISCSVLMCEAGENNTRCAQGCIRSSSGGHHARKRELVSQSSRHFISQGPLRLRRSAEQSGSPVAALNLNLVFIGGCLLAATVIIGAVVMYKARVTSVRYQPLPTFES